MARNRLYLNPNWLGIWHVVNIIMCIVLIATGLCLYYSPKLTMFIDFAHAHSWHKLTGILLLANFFIFFIGNIICPGQKHNVLLLKGKNKKLLSNIKHHTYMLTMYILFPFCIITGFLMMYPEKIVGDIAGFSGLAIIDLVHLVTGYLISLFLLIHMYFSSIGHTTILDFTKFVHKINHKLKIK